MRFRKKPVVIEAIKVEQKDEHTKEVPGWLLDGFITGKLSAEGDAVLIKTLEGTMRADQGDWIIRGVKGELYPCKPDIRAVLRALPALRGYYCRKP